VIFLTVDDRKGDAHNFTGIPGLAIPCPHGSEIRSPLLQMCDSRYNFYLFVSDFSLFQLITMRMSGVGTNSECPQPLNPSCCRVRAAASHEK
jgi:hypothetical protein